MSNTITMAGPESFFICGKDGQINDMKVALETENIEVLNGDTDLLERIQAVLISSKPPVKDWIIAQLESALAQIHFLEAILRNPPPPVREITPNRLLTPQEASELLRVPTRWIYRHSKKLPHRKFGRYIRFSERDLLRWVELKQTR